MDLLLLLTSRIRLLKCRLSQEYRNVKYGNVHTNHSPNDHALDIKIARKTSKLLLDM